MASGDSKVLTAVSIASGVAVGGWMLHRITDYISGSGSRRKWDDGLVNSARLQEKMKEWPKDTVILHALPRGKLAPHFSPFVLKLETFLRMHRIPYLFDSEFPKGEKAKLPWITLNGKHYTDSQLIMKFLTSKFNLKPQGSYSETDKVIGTMARVMVDEHMFWGVLLWRYVYAKGDYVKEIMYDMTDSELKAFIKMTNDRYSEFAWYQGIGRHSQSEVIAITLDDIRTISKLLGSKRFILGDEPCDDDCSVFGMLAMFIWNDVKSPFTKVINEELPNIKEYCLRMKEMYWEDWDEVIKAV